LQRLSLRVFRYNYRSGRMSLPVRLTSYRMSRQMVFPASQKES